MRQYDTIYGTPLTGEAYLSENDGFWTVIHKPTMGGTVWAYFRIFEHIQDERGAWNTMKGNLKKTQMRDRKNKIPTCPLMLIHTQWKISSLPTSIM